MKSRPLSEEQRNALDDYFEATGATMYDVYSYLVKEKQKQIIEERLKIEREV